MNILSIYKKDASFQGTIKLEGSKSISNRIQIIRALAAEHFDIENLSESDDVVAMFNALKAPTGTIDVGAAGTTFRFLTAYLSTSEGEQILTGSARMKERPIGVLVEALKTLGANIEYLEKEGYPPLKIGSPNLNATAELSIASDTSSQFISALLLIAPSLKQGLKLNLVGEMVSRPYIQMTLSLMAHFGIQYTWEGNTISVPAQKYESKDFFVESDWSAASYYYGIMALAEKGSVIKLIGLDQNSLQGDAVVTEMGNKFGITSVFDANEKSVTLTKSSEENAPLFEWDFIECPDIAQTLAVMCAATGTQGLFTGLQTLKIKETDRVAAIKTELKKVGGNFVKLPPHFSKNSDQEHYITEDKASVKDVPRFATYHDHRMAMAFAPLAILGKIEFENPSVVNKSYTKFWDDFESLGFEIEKG